jgi:hypothetical protein
MILNTEPISSGDTSREEEKGKRWGIEFHFVLIEFAFAIL